MNIDSNTMVSISEANQNFSKVARLVDQYGSAVILKNNMPKYVIMTFEDADRRPSTSQASDAEVLEASRKLMERNRTVYEELAK